MTRRLHKVIRTGVSPVDYATLRKGRSAYRPIHSPGLREEFGSAGAIACAGPLTAPASIRIEVPSGQITSTEFPRPVEMWWISRRPRCHGSMRVEPAEFSTFRSFCAGSNLYTTSARLAEINRLRLRSVGIGLPFKFRREVYMNLWNGV